MSNGDGESYLEFYEDMLCTKVLPKDSEGRFIIEKSRISNNALSPLTIPVWCKNIGTNNAYDVSINVVSSNIDIGISYDTPVIKSGQVGKAMISINIPQNSTVNAEIIFDVEYDNI